MSHCTVGVCSSPVHCEEIGRCFSAPRCRTGTNPPPTSAKPPAPPGPPPVAKPDFYVEVVMGGYPDAPDEWRYPRLSWRCAGGFTSGGMGSSVEWRQARLGRYACFRVAPIGVDVPLVEPAVELDVALAERLEQAFATGYVANEDLVGLRAAIAAARGAAL